ncbi:MAG: NADH-quinone oxidoreductase subunit NuoN [Pseudomonadota bacterium]|nr:NADH-quinone oxidoreductase subunit NuoN [Pseudomonadota bacterium]
MNFVSPDFSPVVPEIFLLCMTSLILVVDLFVDDRRRYVTYLLSLLSVLVTAILCVPMLEQAAVETFGGMFVLDRLAVALKIAVLVTVAAVMVYSRDYLASRGLHKGEFYLLTLFATMGMMVIISGAHFITLYLGLELMSLSLYAMVALNRDSAVAAEAAMKYFVLGAIASGMLLYGMSILYGVTGSLYVAQVAEEVMAARVGNVALILGVVFIVASLAFKLGAVPFHMWLPDVYQGANTPITLLVGTAPKIAGFAMFMRLLVEGLEGLYADWRDMLILMSVLSLAVGSIVAIAQTNIKRMLAYSTIGHIGFLLLGIIAGTDEGYGAAMFYTLVYVLMAAGAFGMIILLSHQGLEAENIDDFKGLNERSPWFALIMLLLMFSMAGVPPTVGFYSKLAVLNAVVQQGMYWLAIVAVIFAFISAYYYLRVVKVMYFDAPTHHEPFEPSFDMRALLTANGLIVLILGIVPGGLMELCASAF